MTFRAHDLNTNEAIGPVRHSVHFARSDALRYCADTGRHATVLKTESVWTTQTPAEARKEA